MLKRLVATAAERLGYTVIPHWAIETYPGTRHLRRLFALLGVDLVIDVGANAGQYRDMLRDQVRYGGRIVSFEPVPRLAQAMAVRAASDPLWEVDARALGATAGTAEFNIMASTQFSSFLPPRHDDVTLFTELNSVRERVLVEITTLDAVLPPLMERHAPRRVFLKLDTQGFDLEALKGGEASLPGVAALQTEASVRPIYEGAPDYRALIDHLTARGFVVSAYFPNNGGHFPQLIEFDCCMIRKDLVG